MEIFCNIIYKSFLIGYILLIIISSIKILIKNQKNSSSLTWLLIIFFIPIIGLIIWFFFSEIYLSKRRIKILKKVWLITDSWMKDLKKVKYIFEEKNSKVAKSLFKLCYYRQGILGVKSNKITLLNNTVTIIDTLIQDIKLAKKNIEMVFYIWYPGGLADEVAKALIFSSKKGIRCRLILDSAGSLKFFKSPWLKRMQKSGIQIVESLKLNIFRIFLSRIDIRQHRKIILIDDYIAYTGSMNLVDPYLFKKSYKIGQWIDLMIRIEGPIAITMGIIYSCDWEIETGVKILPKFINNKHLDLKKKKYYPVIQVIPSGPGFPKNIIHQSLLISIYSAKKKITITTPYLIPSNDLLNAICIMSKKGIEINIIIPLYSDSVLVKWASNFFFNKLLDSGVNIYQFDKGLLHSKSILVDQQLSLIGTVNLDMRSLWLNFEITLAIDDHHVGKKLACIHNYYISQSKLLDRKLWKLRSFWKKFIEKIFYLCSPLL